jgi:hypothetical protein
MPAAMRRSIEPANTTTVKNVVTVKAEVDKLLPEKYLETSYQAPPVSFFESQTA